jgi:hypothetical protein
LPSINDIQDGLFKLILFSNINSLKLNEKEVTFSVQLKLTGCNIKGHLTLPCSLEEIDKFMESNLEIFSKSEKDSIKKLAQEAEHNENLKIEIVANNKL